MEFFDEYDDEYDDGDDDGRDRRRSFNKAEKQLMYKAQGGRCMYCGAKKEFEDMEADHKTPWDDGGATDVKNGQMLCRRCNGRKSTFTDSEFRKYYKLPPVRSPEAKDPPEERIPQSYFDDIDKKKRSAANRKRRDEEEYDDDEDYEDEDDEEYDDDDDDYDDEDDDDY